MTLLFCVVFFGYLQYMFIFGFSIWNKFLGKEKQKGQLKGYLCVKCEFTFIDSWMINSYSDDKELQCSLRRGTISAFVYIYTTYYDALLNYADRLLNDVETPGMWFNRYTIRSGKAGPHWQLLFPLRPIFLNRFITVA